MADSMDLQITISGQNETGNSFSSVDSQMNTLNSLAETVTRTFQSFINTITSAFGDAGRSVEELSRPIEDIASQANTTGRSLEEMLRPLFDTQAERSAEEIARSIGDIGREAQNTTRQLQTMDEAASRPATPAGGGAHGSGAGGHGAGEGGLFSMQGQMDTMYAGMSMGAAALPLDGAIKASIDSYGQFSQAMANVNSMMGLSQTQLAGLSNQVLALSKNVPDGPVALANALYGIVGAGVPASSQMAVLATASKAATAGQTDVSTATQALISVMNSYGLTGKDVNKISDEMFAANAAGAMTFTDFAKSIGTVAGPAAQAGVSFAEVGAATAALTNQGMDAQRATEGLRALMVGIMSPTAGATKEAKKLGIEWDANALKSKGLAGMVDLAMKATHGNSEELKKLIPNIAAWTDAIDLGGKGADSFKQAMDTMGKSAGSTDKALEAQEQGYQEQMKKMQNSLQTAEIAMAQGFIPALTSVIDKIGQLATAFSKLSPNQQKLIGEVTLGAAAFLTLGSAFFMTISSIGGMIQGFTAIGGAVKSGVTAFRTFATAVREVGLAEAFMDAMSPAGWIILIGTALVAIGVLVYTHWNQIKAFFVTTWQAISSAISIAWNGIKTFFSGLWVSISQTATNTWNGIKNFFTGLWNGITQTASSIWNGMINGIKNLWNGAVSWVVGAGQAFANGIVNAFNWMYNHNYYFKDLVDFIRNAWDTITKDAQAVWNTITSWLSNLWNGIKNTASSVWNGLVNVLSRVWDAIKSAAQSFWNMEKQGFENIWNGIVSVARTVWNGLTSFFSGLWNGISSGVSSAWNGIKNTLGNLVNGAINALKGPFNSLGSFFSGLWGQAEQWGANLVNMMAQGIKNAAGAVGNAVKSVASSIAGFLGFHSPTKEGPASDSDTWMPNMIKMFTEGIHHHAPQLQMAINSVALGVKTGITTPLTQNISSTMAMPSGASRSTQPIFQVHVSGNITRNEKELGDIVSRAIFDKAKMQGRI